MAVNYQLELERELQKNEGKTPRLLLHCCCAPLSLIHILERLNVPGHRMPTEKPHSAQPASESSGQGANTAAA